MHDTSSNDNEASARWLRPELVAPWWEITLLLCVMLGPFAISAVRYGLQGAGLDLMEKLINTRGITHNIAIEGGMLAAMLFYLRWRGWRPADFSIRIDVLGTLLAPPLLIAAMLANLGVCLLVFLTVLELAPHPHGLVASLLATLPRAHPHHIELAWTAIIIGSIVNAYLEELVFMGYGFQQFAARRGPLFALLVMVFLRMLLHTYKGPVGMLGISAFSLVYGLTFIQTRRLWPLILAHIVTDLLAFAALKLMFSH